MDMTTEGTQIARAQARRDAAAPGADGVECLGFRVGGDEYAIDVLCVQEIRAYEPPTAVAGAPHFVRGVVNLRGVIMPVVDLRLRLACARADCDSLTAVIVVHVHGRVVGIVVDSVSDVFELDRAGIRPLAGLERGLHEPFVTGIGTVRDFDGDRALRLMDIEALLSSADLGLAHRTATV